MIIENLLKKQKEIILLTIIIINIVKQDNHQIQIFFQMTFQTTIDYLHYNHKYLKIARQRLKRNHLQSRTKIQLHNLKKFIFIPIINKSLELCKAIKNH